MKNLLNRILILLFAVLSVIPVYSDSVDAKRLFEEGNALYQKQEYHKAIVMYDSLLRSGIVSSNLYYNTGNTNYKLGDYTKAILYYEKAILKGGREKDILHNLELANLNITDKIEAIPDFILVRIWNNTLYMLSSKKWGIFSITLFILVLFLVIVIFVAKSVSLKKLIIPLLAIVIFFFFLATTFTIQKTSLEKNSHYAIVFEPTVYVMSAPDKQSTNLFLIHEGLKVQLLDKINAWIKIELADGKIGWIPEGSYQEI